LILAAQAGGVTVARGTSWGLGLGAGSRVMTPGTEKINQDFKPRNAQRGNGWSADETLTQINAQLLAVQSYFVLNGNCVVWGKKCSKKVVL